MILKISCGYLILSANFMRKKRWLILLTLILMILFGKWLASDTWVISAPASDTSLGVYNSASNNRQYGTTAWLGTYDGKLLMYRDREIAPTLSLKKHPEYDGKLLLFDGEKVTVLHPLCARNDEAHIVGQAGQYVYYWSWSTSFWDRFWDRPYHTDLYCYDLEHDTATKLYSDHESMLKSMNYFDEDGSVYIALYGEAPSDPGGFLHVKGDIILETVSSAPGYRVGGKTVWPDYPPIFLTNRRLPETVFCSDDNGAKEKLTLVYGGGRSVIPTAQGVLIHTENSGGCVLYHMDEQGTLHELFNADCMSSRSAVAVHKSTVFLSIFRFEKLDDAWAYFPEPFENDTISGTYRISLEDYSVQKISDAAYRGLFLFDHHSLFGCDKYGNIEQIDFDGNVLSRPVEIKPHWPF